MFILINSACACACPCPWMLKKHISRLCHCSNHCRLYAEAFASPLSLPAHLLPRHCLSLLPLHCLSLLPTGSWMRVVTT